MTLVDKRFKQGGLALSLIFLFTSCLSSKEVYLISGKTMGTTYSIKLASNDVDSIKIKEKIEKALFEVNRQMSTYIPTSEISLLNKAEEGVSVKISPWFYKVLDFSLGLAKKTKGSYDPTLGPLINLWGFGPNGNKEVPEREKIDEALAIVGYHRVYLSKASGEFFAKKTLSGTYVDLSSSAKGFGVDVLAELLNKEGFKNYLVEVGGELRASGSKFGTPWRVAVEKPSSDGRSLQKAFDLKNLSIATSGDYRNFFNAGNKKYSHTLYVNTGEPVQHKLVSVSVLSKSCMEADALATALMSMGPEKAKVYSEENKLSVYLIYEGAGAKLETFETPVFTSLTN